MILHGIIASTLAGLATGIGGLCVFFLNDIRPRVMDGLLGVSAGIMLAATSFSLLVPALENTTLLLVSLGIGSGALLVMLADRAIPHLHFIKGFEGPSVSLRRIWLFILAITIHNFPEGLSVGVGFGMKDVRAAVSLAMGIGIQNIPEGLAVAMPLRKENYSKTRSFSYALFSGLVEPVGGAIGVVAVSLMSKTLGYFLAFAAGAMLFVIIDEIFTEINSRGNQREATLGALGGFILMMVLDNIF